MKRLLLVFSIGWFFVASVALAAPTPRDSGLTITEVAAGLDTPTTMAFIGPQDFLVLQKNDGRVRRVIAGVLQPNPVLDVAVDSSSERGLLGIALHPDFPVSSFVYLYYTESTTGGDSSGSAAANRVYRYTWNGTALTAPLLILELPVDPGPNHNGGAITFGPDGKLYVVIGDLNRDGRLQNFPDGPAPDDTSVILRINPDGSIPSDNPFFAQGGNLAKYFAYGIRNSFGLTFDPVTDELWMTEHGPDAYDEINLVQPGFNSGWETLMGPDSRNSNNASSLVLIPGSHYADPKFSWLKTVGPTAIVFLDSANLGEQYENDVFVGDINNGNLYRFQPNDTRDGFVLSGGGLTDLVADDNSEVDRNIFATGFAGITDLKVGPDGFLYVVSIGDGKIYVISRDTTEPLAIGLTSLAQGEVGVPYSADLSVSGGVEPYTIEVTRGALPAGLGIVSGIIVGTPAQRSGSNFTLRVTDQRGSSLTQRFNLAVVGAVVIGNQNLPAGRAGRRYRAHFRPGAGKKPYVWTLTAGTLPAGLSFDPGTASIAGIPLAATQTDLTFQVTDSLGGTRQRTLTLTIR
jgi:glucose/arabinose dehydrogenase